MLTQTGFSNEVVLVHSFTTFPCDKLRLTMLLGNAITFQGKEKKHLFEF